MESKTEANLAQADGSDDDSSVFSLSVTTPTISNSDSAEWILDSGATFMCARTGPGSLALKGWIDVTRSWGMTIRVI